MGKTAVVEAWVAREEGRFRKVVLAGADPSGAATPLVSDSAGADVAVVAVGATDRAEEIERATGGSSGRSHRPVRAVRLRRRGVEAAARRAAARVRRGGAAVRCGAPMRRWSSKMSTATIRRRGMILGELIAQPGMATVLATTTRHEMLEVEVEIVRLPPLDPMALTDLALPPGVADRSNGNPLAIVDELRALAASSSARASRRCSHAAVIAGGDVGRRRCLAQAAGLADVGRALAELALRGCHVAADAEERRHAVADAAAGASTSTMPIAERQRAARDPRVAVARRAGREPVGRRASCASARARPRASALLERAGDAARDGLRRRRGGALVSRGARARAAGAGRAAAGDELTADSAWRSSSALVQRYRGDVVPSEHVLREALDLARGARRSLGRGAGAARPGAAGVAVGKPGWRA